MKLSLLEHFLCNFREGVLQGSVANLGVDELLEVFRGFLGVKLEGVLTLFPELGIIAVQVPVAGLDCEFLWFMLVPIPVRIPWLMQGSRQ